MAGISIHVVDVSRGVPAAGMAVEVYALDPRRERIGGGIVDARGQLDDAALASRVLSAGMYEAHFEVGRYYRDAGVALPTPAFLETAAYSFGIAEPTQHYHLPFKVTPWGYSLFRGGA